MRNIFWLICLSALWMFAACSDDLDTGTSAQPKVSADTLDVGMLLAGNSSQTYGLKLYNRNSGEIRLSSIVLRNAGTSGFRMNVDGMNGSSFTNPDLLRIASGDSLFLFVEATFEARSGRSHTDYIDVTCNGKTQSIVLKGECRDVEIWRTKTIDADVRVFSGSEIQIYDSLVVAEGAKLILEDSVVLYLHDKADIHLYGTLICEGTAGRPVILRGDRTDKMFVNLSYDGLPAQWGNLYVHSSSSGNVWNWADIHGMTDGIRIEPGTIDTELTEDEEQRITFRHCRISLSDSTLIRATGAQCRMEGCLLSNAGGALLNIQGGAWEIDHCTLANYCYTAWVTTPALCLTNPYDYPLWHCNVSNTLVWSKRCNPSVTPNASDVQLVYQEFISPDGSRSDSIFHYRFDHCLLAANGTDDNEFISTVWAKDPLYLLLDDANYTYDFRLQAESPAIGVATDSQLETDLDNTPWASKPAIGCYEYVQ